MNNIINVLFELIRASLNSTAPDLSEEAQINWDTLYSIAKYHSLTGLMSYAAEQCSNVPEAVLEKFRQDQMVNIYREANHEIMVNQVIEAFEAVGINCMPLKGFIIKHMYPSVDMRDMCDVDILIHEEDIEKIKPVMASADFKYIKESPHEFVFSSALVTIELHKCLVSPYNKDLYDYYGDGWRVAKHKPDYEHVFEMSPDDFYVYTLAHLAKHYINGGAGIKQVIDIYVLRKQCENLDYDYIDDQLAQIGIDRFHSILCELINVWFGDGAYTEVTAQMAEYIINSGTFGTQENSDNSLVYKASENGDYNKTKRSFFISVLFPPCKAIAKRYPVLNNNPWLYPFVNFYRWFDVLINRHDKIKSGLAKTHMDNEGVSRFEQLCSAAGLSRTL